MARPPPQRGRRRRVGTVEASSPAFWGSPSAGWVVARRGYFEMVSAYCLSVDRLLAEGAEVALFGTASGSLCGPDGQIEDWSIPFAARARVESGLVQEWRVFADNEPVRAILR